MSIETKLNQLVSSGYSPAYIESVLWASYSGTHSLQTIARMVEEANPGHNK